MKKIKQIWIVLGLMASLSLGAQTLARMPEAQMRSTSAMAYSGTTLPHAAVHGVYVTGSTPGTYSPYSPVKASGRPRRVGENEGYEDEADPDNPGEPFPIGDAALPMMLLAAAYALLRAFRRRQARE